MTSADVLTNIQSTVSEMITFMLPIFAWVTAFIIVLVIIVKSIYGLIRRVG